MERKWLLYSERHGDGNRVLTSSLATSIRRSSVARWKISHSTLAHPQPSGSLKFLSESAHPQTSWSLIGSTQLQVPEQAAAALSKHALAKGVGVGDVMGEVTSRHLLRCGLWLHLI